jgi:hypothetical protein
MQDAKSEHRHMGLSRWIPALRWLPAYDRFWLRGDVVAGITLAAYLLPAAAIARVARAVTEGLENFRVCTPAMKPLPTPAAETP